MKVKIKDIYSCRNALAKVASSEMPINMSFKFARMLKALNEEYSTIEEQRVGLVQKHGEKVSDSEHQIKSDEQKEKFMKDFEKLLDEEIDVDYEKISINDMQGINISPQELSILSFTFTDFE